MDELLCRISSRELTEWAAYEQVHGPIGPERGDIQAAVIASTIAAVNRDKGKPAPRLKDFMVQYDRAPVSTDEMFKTVQAITSAMGGTNTWKAADDGAS